VEERYAQGLYIEGELPAYVNVNVVSKIDVGLFSGLDVLTDVPNIQHSMFPTSDVTSEPMSESDQEPESVINITFV
jgi:hypothetical protein